MKAAIYGRLSDEDRNKQFATDDSESIQNQKLMLTQYATEHGWEIYDIYTDDDYTGADRNRPEFNRL
ncbi:MAG: recombinase family protein, partial [Clostridia bacterium]|nr:recombinase family protein [Clostridia bacterium]